MFIQVELKNSQKILISVPAAGAEKSLPQIIKLFENNAIFLEGYNEFKQYKPEITITLGSTYEHKSYGQDNLVISAPDSFDTIDESFLIATPELYISNKADLAKKDAEIAKLNDRVKLLELEKAQIKEHSEVFQANASQLREANHNLNEELKIAWGQLRAFGVPGPVEVTPSEVKLDISSLVHPLDALDDLEF
jgi:hypothetical protein